MHYWYIEMFILSMLELCMLSRVFPSSEILNSESFVVWHFSIFCMFLPLLDCRLQALQTCPCITSFTEYLWLEWDPRSWHPGSSQGKQSRSHTTFYSQRGELPAEDRWKWHESQRCCCLITLKIWWCNDQNAIACNGLELSFYFVVPRFDLKGGFLEEFPWSYEGLYTASTDTDVFFAKTSWPIEIDKWMMVHGPTCFVLLLVDQALSSVTFLCIVLPY